MVAASALAAPFISRPEAATLELRWLGWEHYNVKELTAAFEQEHGVKVSAGFFDGNSEAYNKLRAGGTQDFDLVMADGFWPRLYAKQGLTQPVDYGQLDMSNVFPDFRPPNYMLLQQEDGEAMIAAPNCWGGYGFTVNTDEVAAADQETVGLLFNEAYQGHLSTSARFEENIALAGILAASEMGTIEAARPDGKPFNPYVLTDAELERCKELLIRQKGLLVTRWNDEDTLERLLRAGVVWASPEWSGIYRRIHFDKLDGKTDLNMRHVLKPTEGGLGWVDTWCITAGADRQREAGGGAQMDRLPPRQGEHGDGRDRDRLGADRRRARPDPRALRRDPVPQRDQRDPGPLPVRRAVLAGEVGTHLVRGRGGLIRRPGGRAP